MPRNPKPAERLEILRLPDSHWYIDALDPSVPGIAPIDHTGVMVPESMVERVMEQAEQEGIILEKGEGLPPDAL